MCHERVINICIILDSEYPAVSSARLQERQNTNMDYVTFTSNVNNNNNEKKTEQNKVKTMSLWMETSHVHAATSAARWNGRKRHEARLAAPSTTFVKKSYSDVWFDWISHNENTKEQLAMRSFLFFAGWNRETLFGWCQDDAETNQTDEKTRDKILNAKHVCERISRFGEEGNDGRPRQ